MTHTSHATCNNVDCHYRNHFYGNTTFKKNSICLSRRGHRLAWSRIPSLLKLHYIISLRYWPGALAVVGSNPTGPNDLMGSHHLGKSDYDNLALQQQKITIRYA